MKKPKAVMGTAGLLTIVGTAIACEIAVIIALGKAIDRTENPWAAIVLMLLLLLVVGSAATMVFATVVVEVGASRRDKR